MPKAENAPITALSGFFFASGVSALVYQVAWQRILFVAFGVDLESVTIIVASFMLGLGCGALLGGYLADRFPRHTLALFALAEAGLGLFACFSAAFLRAAGEWFLQASPAALVLINAFLLLLPTMLMGATLPILVAHLTRCWRNVGRSTGAMYAANTLGAALGAFMTGFVLLNSLDLDQTILLAAAINISVAIGVSLFLRNTVPM